MDYSSEIELLREKIKTNKKNIEEQKRRLEEQKRTLKNDKKKLMDLRGTYNVADWKEEEELGELKPYVDQIILHERAVELSYFDDYEKIFMNLHMDSDKFEWIAKYRYYEFENADAIVKKIRIIFTLNSIIIEFIEEETEYLLKLMTKDYNDVDWDHLYDMMKKKENKVTMFDCKKVYCFLRVAYLLVSPKSHKLSNLVLDD